MSHELYIRTGTPEDMAAAHDNSVPLPQERALTYAASVDKRHGPHNRLNVDVTIGVVKGTVVRRDCLCV